MTYAVSTLVGSRPVNEDSARIIAQGGRTCFIVADGLGGHGMGDVASQTAAAAFEQVFTRGQGSLEELLSQGFAASQKAILDEQLRRGCPHKMKTTVVALAMEGGQLAWGHIGDSRLYAFQKNKVRERTLDHSVPQMLVLAHEIKEKDIRHHPDRNKLMRVLGIQGDSPKYQIAPTQPAGAFQAFLLCSDGFWELILEKEMCSTLKKSRTVEEWLDQMVKIVYARGAGTDMDNNTAIAIWM